MKVGTLVRNRYAIPRPCGNHVAPGHTGVVVAVRESAQKNRAGVRDVWVDVVLTVDGQTVHRHLDHPATFEAIA